MLTTICYGEKKEWKNRQEAAGFFLNAMMDSDGSERERYTNIYVDIISGKSVCTDHAD